MAPYSELSDNERAAVETFGGGVQLYNIKQVAVILGVTPRTVNTYITTGRIHATKIGGRWRVLETDLQRMIDEGSNR